MADDQQSPNEKEGKLNQLPLSKIKTIMKSSPDLVNVSQDSVFLITKATVSETERVNTSEFGKHVYGGKFGPRLFDFYCLSKFVLLFGLGVLMYHS